MASAFLQAEIELGKGSAQMYSTFVGELRSPGHDETRCALFLSK